MITGRFFSYFICFILINLLTILIVNSDFKKIKSLAYYGVILSLMLMIITCFFPFPIQNELLEDMITNNEGVSNNFIPLKSILTFVIEGIKYKSVNIIIYQLFGNIVLFIPLGFSLQFYLEENRKFLRMILCVVFVSISIEAFQAFFGYLIEINYRSTDIDDIILNVLGGILGFLAAVNIKEYLLGKRIKK